MKILLYTELEKTIGKSGLGKAIQHQIRALEENGIEYTKNPHDDYDIAHINWYGIKSYMVAKKAKRMGKKVIYHAHSTEEDFRNSFKFSNAIAPLFKWWICKCYRLGDFIITPTEYSKKLLENYNLNRPIKAISNGIDTTVFKPSKKLGDEFRKKYGFKNDDKVILGIGLYLERKGILDFVELAKRLKDYKFIWFGYTDLKLVPKKIKDAVNTKLDNLIFAGYVPQEEIIKAMNGADLYIFPTLEETEGIPILEALACKQNAIVRDIGVFDWLRENEDVYKAKDVDDFEVKIKKIINKELPSLTQKGYKIACMKDVKKVGNELINVYNDVLNEKY